MSKGGLLCWLLLLEVCIAQLSLISISQLTAGGPIGDDDLLFQDPIRMAPLMSSHGHDELGGHSSDSTFDDRVDTGDEFASINRGVPVAGGRVGDEEEEGLLPPYGDDDGGDSGGTKGSSGSGGVDVECPECGKFFKNHKSMFGHLRSHPNRGYKGAIPPVKKLKQSPGTTATASASSSSPGTDRTQAQRSSRDPQLTPLEILCAYVLLTLKYRDSSRQTTKVPQPTSFSFGKLDAMEQAECGTGGSVTGNAAAELKRNAGAEAGNLENCDEHEYSTVKIPKKRRNMSKKLREAHRKKARIVPTMEKRPYSCKHCKAEFSSNQALGGHVAGHHREKKVPRLNDPSAMAAESQNGKQQVKDDDDDDDKDLPLRRGLLSEQFSTALDMPSQSGQQASGGKMRHHYGRRNDGLSMAVAAPTPTPINDRGARRPWNIDLNVEAPEQE